MQVREVMIPRAQMTTVARQASYADAVQLAVNSGYSRFPVIGEKGDEVVGILLAKDLLRYTRGEDAVSIDLARIMRPVVFVPESKRVNVMLKDFRKSRHHMAVVADEYGGVAGLVTIEDVLETIVGEIDDEYDISESAFILKQDERHFLVNALTPIKQFNEYFHAEFSDQEFDTVGGLVTHRFGHLPRRGESVQIDRFQFNVQRADSRRVQQLQVTLLQT
jgi:magnesium and cobalt transporter